MVAYSFKSSFLQPIESGEKQQTIRLTRKRHARVGEALQMFTGPRMKPRRIGAAVCLAARDVRLDFEENLVVLDDAIEIRDPAALHAFAIRDGFNPPKRLNLRPWAYMARWWGMTHPEQPVFRGVLIDWGSTFEGASQHG